MTQCVLDIPQKALYLCLVLAGLVSCRHDAHDHRVSLTWQASPSTRDSTVIGYNIYRRSNANRSYVKLASGIPSTFYEDRLVETKVTYFYTVSAVDQKGRESRPSNTFTVTIP